MEVRFYILGSNSYCGPWNWVEGPLDKYPELESWVLDEYTYQYYKVEKVWEIPF